MTSTDVAVWRGATVPLLRSAEVARASLTDYFAWAASSQFYMGPPAPVTLYGNRPAEPISNSFAGFVWGMLYADGPVASVEQYRLRVFGQAPLLYQRMAEGRAGEFFDAADLDRLRSPWPGGTLADLMKRALVFGDFAGNAFVIDLDDELVAVRPDWVEIVLEKRMFRGGQVGWRQVGIVYYEGGLGVGDGVAFTPGEYAHFVPGLPDPLATYRGMSWLTPLVREVQADKAARDHKLAYLENAASPNLAVGFPKEMDADKFKEWVEKLDAQHKGSANAGKTLYTGGGADVTVIGSNMQQADFAGVVGKGENRIANAGGVPAVLLGFSEGLQGSSLNSGNYTASKRNFVDTTMRDLWANWCGSLAQMEAFRPGDQTRLWYDGRDIPFLHEDMQDLATIQAAQAGAINTHVTAGWKPESARDAVLHDDLSLLQPSGFVSVQLAPPGQGSGSQGSANGASPQDLASYTSADQAAIRAMAGAFLDDDEIERRFNPAQPRGFHGRWIKGFGQAIRRVQHAFADTFRGTRTRVDWMGVHFLIPAGAGRNAEFTVTPVDVAGLALLAVPGGDAAEAARIGLLLRRARIAVRAAKVAEVGAHAAVKAHRGQATRASVHGHHVKGTPDEWMHGWIPVAVHEEILHFDSAADVQSQLHHDGAIELIVHPDQPPDPVHGDLRDHWHLHTEDVPDLVDGLDEALQRADDGHFDPVTVPTTGGDVDLTPRRDGGVDVQFGPVDDLSSLRLSADDAEHLSAHLQSLADEHTPGVAESVDVSPDLGLDLLSSHRVGIRLGGSATHEPTTLTVDDVEGIAGALRDLAHQAPHRTAPAKRPGLLGRMFRKAPALEPGGVERDEVAMRRIRPGLSVSWWSDGSASIDAGADGITEVHIPADQVQATADALARLLDRMTATRAILRGHPYPEQKWTHGWHRIGGVARDALNLAGRIDLATDEHLTYSGDYADAKAAVTDSPVGQMLRLGLAVGDVAWRGNKGGRTARLTQEQARQVGDAVHSAGVRAKAAQDELNRVYDRIDTLSPGPELDAAQAAADALAGGSFNDIHPVTVVPGDWGDVHVGYRIHDAAGTPAEVIAAVRPHDAAWTDLNGANDASSMTLAEAGGFDRWLSSIFTDTAARALNDAVDEAITRSWLDEDEIERRFDPEERRIPGGPGGGQWTSKIVPAIEKWLRGDVTGEQALAGITPAILRKAAHDRYGLEFPPRTPTRVIQHAFLARVAEEHGHANPDLPEPAKAAEKAAVRPRPLRGQERAALAKDYVRAYVTGAEVGEIAKASGRSDSFVRLMLRESGVSMRQPGAGRRLPPDERRRRERDVETVLAYLRDTHGTSAPRKAAKAVPTPAAPGSTRPHYVGLDEVAAQIEGMTPEEARQHLIGLGQPASSARIAVGTGHPRGARYSELYGGFVVPTAAPGSDAEVHQARTIAELRDIAKARGITIPSGLKKDQIREHILSGGTGATGEAAKAASPRERRALETAAYHRAAADRLQAIANDPTRDDVERHFARQSVEHHEREAGRAEQQAREFANERARRSRGPLVVSDVAARVRAESSIDGAYAALDDDRLTPVKLRHVASELGLSVPASAKTQKAIRLWIANEAGHGRAGVPTPGTPARGLPQLVAPHGQLPYTDAELRGVQHIAPQFQAEQVAKNRAHTIADLLAHTEALRESGASPQAMESRIRSHGKDLTPELVDRLVQADVQDRIRAAYRDLQQRPGDWVPLAALRDHPELAGIDRAEVDKALTSMATQPGHHLIPWDNRKALTAADHAAAVHFGGGPNHVLRLEDTSPRVPAELDRLASQYGLHRTTPNVGGVEPYNPVLHERLPGSPEIPAGTPVQIVRPGYDATVHGTRVQAVKAAVILHEPAETHHLSPAEIDRRIMAAHEKIRNGSDALGAVSLADLRRELPDIPRDQLDARLEALAQRQDVHLFPQEAQQLLTEADRAAAVTVGRRPYHFLHVEPGRGSTRRAQDPDVGEIERSDEGETDPKGDGLTRGHPHPGQRYTHGWIPVAAGGVRDSLARAATTAEVCAAAEAEAEAITGRFVTFDLARQDPQLAREHCEAILRGLERYPDAPLQSVIQGADPEHEASDAWAVTDTRGHITFTNHGQSRGPQVYRAVLEQSQRDSDIVVGTPMGVAIHEFGHVINESRDMAIAYGTGDTPVFAAQRLALEAGQAFDVHVGENLSNYATESQHELAAEAFADVMTNGAQASELSKAVVAAMNSAYTRAGGTIRS